MNTQQIIRSISSCLANGVAVLVLPGNISQVVTSPVGRMCSVKRSAVQKKTVRAKTAAHKAHPESLTPVQRKKLAKVFTLKKTYSQMAKDAGIGVSSVTQAVCALRRATVMATPRMIKKWLDGHLSTNRFYGEVSNKFVAKYGTHSPAEV